MIKRALDLFTVLRELSQPDTKVSSGISSENTILKENPLVWTRDRHDVRCLQSGCSSGLRLHLRKYRIVLLIGFPIIFADNPSLESKQGSKHPGSPAQFESIAKMAELKYMVDIDEKLERC
jgi:hypothetical protein